MGGTASKDSAHESLDRTIDDAVVQLDILTTAARSARWGRNVAAICAGTLATLAITALVLATLAAMKLITSGATNEVLGVVAASGAVIGYLVLGIGVPEMMARNDHLGEINKHEARMRASIATAQQHRRVRESGTQGETAPSRIMDTAVAG